ncbi:nuclear pore complex protein DDB_G0274915 [Calliphora vicina]|uniref:nuclear pore complex protein DDB_G0274915 n=1 Tax=Calliphora vicina TaxID=7373 RepID=UPI00325B76D2
MRLFKSIFTHKMLATRNFKGKLFLSAFVFMVLLNFTVADSRTHIPARILAKQTGATQFEEEQYETHADCSDHKHHLKKRASDEDVDYEVYQGVVGRPGIDFPIYPRIPKTSFSCRSYGNGYFADMETDCQVFHICEEGRKISFLCPNGTIFQQSELTCDWWFKVNCLGSSGFYADSTELLNKQKVQRLKPSIPVQGFNIVGGGLNIKPRVPAKGNARSRVGSVSANNGNSKSDRRIDSDEAPSLESVDFDDLSSEKQRGASAKPEISNIDNNDNENESQVVAESASFVSNRNRNNFNYDKVKLDNTPKTSSLVKSDNGRRGAGDRGSQRHGYGELNADSTERGRGGQRGQQRYRDDKKPESFDRNDKVKPTKKDRIVVDNSNDKLNNPTATYNSGTYTTARRFESTRTTPFYTPTVPSVSKSKTTEGKAFYIKGATATTPTPHRFNVNNNGAGIFLESTGASAKTTANPVEFEITGPTTLKPIIIGMRHYFDKDFSSDIKPKSNINLEVSSRSSNHKYDSDDFFPTTTPATTGPTYLPKSKSIPRLSLDAAGDSFLFAPISVPQEEISRNVNDMLKTINVLKHNFDDVELIKVNGKNRLGLDIPPSSGPDALISLAQYFATEQHNDNTSKNLNSLEDNASKKTSHKNNNENGSGNGNGNRIGENGNGSGSTSGNGNGNDIANRSGKPTNTLAPKEKLSDTTATLTTEATPSLAVNSDDIHTSLLSNGTVNKYNTLFGLNASDNSNVDPLQGLADTNAPKPKDINTPFPQIGTTDATIKALSEKPESRKIAQVFSNALTNYLNDPAKFRESLAAVRPTDPTVDKNSKFVTVTDSTLFNQGTAATYLPTTPTQGPNTADATTQSNIASVINTNLITSTFTPDSASTTEDYDSTTFKSSSEQKSSLELSAELEPPTPDSGEGEEFLQREQTQSFVKPRNELFKNKDKSGKVTTVKPWSFIEEDDILDPLKINDGLMKFKTTTLSPYAYLPRDETTILPRSRHSSNFQVLSTHGQRSQLQHGNSELLESKHNSRLRSETAASADPWQDIFDSYDLPKDSLPSNTGLQRIANKLFGGLNENEAYHLRNVMAEAEHNRQVLRLLLLLIQTCDDQNGRALERSRKHLINALINMDGKINDETAVHVKNSHHKDKPLTTTEQLPVTTYRKTGSGEEISTSTLSYPSTTTDLPTTTTITGSTTPTTTDGSSNSSGESTTTPKFVIKVEDNDKEASTLSAVTVDTEGNSDKRALELLKSLYSLASKFTSRR